MNTEFNTFREIPREMQQCIESCLRCHQVCMQLAPYCLEKGGAFADASLLRALSACSEICRTAAHFMIWGSDLHQRVCDVCSDACLRCLRECEKHRENEMMKICREICLLCAESCQKVAFQH